jgi:putative acetyltransferase
MAESRRADKASLNAGVQDVHTDVVIRRFQERDASSVRDLFIVVNRQLSPPDMRAAFESYIARSLAEEMDRVSAYYREHSGEFWVADRRGEIIGMFGLESAGPGSCELRRMYVAPSARRGGVASLMLRFAEDECRRSAIYKIELSTSELQPAAIELYRRAGYRLVSEAVVADASNKTVGAGIRRFYFEKDL